MAAKGAAAKTTISEPETSGVSRLGGSFVSGRGRYRWLPGRNGCPPTPEQAVRPELGANFRLPFLSAPFTVSHSCVGEVAEWSIVPDSKSGVPERVPGVRIPPSPPVFRKAKGGCGFESFGSAVIGFRACAVRATIGAVGHRWSRSRDSRLLECEHECAGGDQSTAKHGFQGE